MSDLNTRAPPAYSVMQSALVAADAVGGAAECHGLLCGLLCRDREFDRGGWEEQVLADARSDADALAGCRELLAALHADTLRRLDNNEFDFELLLPDDSEPLEHRAKDLASWCQGFLYGIGLGGELAPDVKAGEVGEVLEDIANIARMDFTDEMQDEEGEEAFAEVVEYVRIGVLLVNEELQPPQPRQRLH